MNASSVPFAERLNNFIPKFQSPTVLFVGFFAVNRLIGGLFRKIAIKKPGKLFFENLLTKWEYWGILNIKQKSFRLLYKR